MSRDVGDKKRRGMRGHMEVGEVWQLQSLWQGPILARGIPGAAAKLAAYLRVMREEETQVGQKRLN